MNLYFTKSQLIVSFRDVRSYESTVAANPQRNVVNSGNPMDCKRHTSRKAEFSDKGDCLHQDVERYAVSMGV